MPTLYGNVYFNSGNVNSLVTNLDNSSLIPNRSYTINLNGIDHMKGYGIKSNLSDSYSDNITGYTNPITFSTPADNVESVIDLVRKTDTTISVYVHSLSSPNYGNLTYNGTLRRYTNSGLTNEPTVITTYNNLPKHVDDYSIPNLLTQPYYFASEFENTHGVVKESNGTTVQKNQIFDIRGLAYFRDNLYTSYVDIIYSPSIQLTHFSQSSLRHALSADGSVLLVSYGKSVYVYKHRKQVYTSTFDSEEEIVSTYGLRYDYYKSLGNAVAISGDAKRYVVAYAFTNGPKLYVYDMNMDFTLKEENTLNVPIEYNTKHIHNVCMSMDGNTILISGGIYYGGYAHVYHYENGLWSEPISLSSSIVPYYGTDSCLSGDGKTIAVFGGSSVSTGVGCVWKFNHFTQNWEFIQTLSTDFVISKRISPCSMSHDGYTLLVTAPHDNKWVVFEYDEDNRRFGKTLMEFTPHDQVGSYFMTPGSISGDGKTVVFAENDKTEEARVRVHIFTRNNSDDTFGLSKTIETSNNMLFDLRSPSNVLNVLVSFDGGVVMLGSTSNRYIGENIVTHINGKKNTNITRVPFDYMNVRSNYTHLDYNNFGEPDWDTTLYETNTNKSVAHYGIVDALSMSANGQRVIVGSPEENKAYLYDNNSLVQTYIGSNRFGIRCSMNDYGNIIVIANNSHLNIYVYDGTTAPDSPIRTIAFGGTTDDSPWNMKISKYGSTIIASDFVSSVSFKSWTTADNWVSEPTSKTHTRNVDTSTAISAIDLSYDGSVMVASGFSGPSKGHVHLFKDLGEVSVANVEIAGNNTHYVGQSIALSGLGTKAIVGSPISTLTHSNSAVVHFIDITDNTMSWIPKTYSTAHTVRYGRSVSMDYHGYYAMVSGSGSEFNNYTTGSAIVIDMSGYTKVKELPKIDLSQKGASSVRHDWNGYGIHCKLSSRGDVAAVSGGGYAYLFKADLFLSTLRFPFSTDKESTDGSVKFTGVGTIIDDSLNLVSAQNEVLDLGSNAFQFGTDKGFVVEFDAKITDTSVEAVVLNINSDLFNVEISNYSSSLWQKIHVHSTDTNRAISVTSYAVYSGSWNVFKHFKYMYSHVTKNARTYLNGVETGNVSAATEIQYLPTPTNVNMISYTNKFHIKNLTFRVID
jgi:hypothetical protein